MDCLPAGEAVLRYTERARRKHLAVLSESKNRLVMGDKNRLRQVFINIIDNHQYADQADPYPFGGDKTVSTSSPFRIGCGISPQTCPGQADIY
jgi:signal transduction histidine kinase